MAGDTRTLVVFDVDGTLTDSRPSIYASYRHAALNAGLPIPSDDMLAHHLCGGLPDNVRELFGVEGDKEREEKDRQREQSRQFHHGRYP